MMLRIASSEIVSSSAARPVFCICFGSRYRKAMLSFSSSVYPDSLMDLHAIEERRGDVERVRGRDEHHVREVVVDLEVVDR